MPLRGGAVLRNKITLKWDKEKEGGRGGGRRRNRRRREGRGRDDVPYHGKESAAGWQQLKH